MDEPREHGPAVLWSLAAWWGTAALRALMALFGVGLVAVGLVVLVWFASDPPRPSAVEALRAGGSLLLLFHRVPFSFDLPVVAFGLGPGDALPAAAGSVGVAPLGGTLVVLALLSRGGAAVAGAAGGPALVRGLHGAKVAVPYAALTFLLSFVVGFESTVSGQAGPSLEPSTVGALVWPLVLGLVAGFGGGLSTPPAEDEAAGSWSRLLRGALAGGWRMLWLGLALAFLGVLVLAAVRAHATRAFLEAVADAGVLGGAALLGGTLLVVPNMAAWVLFPAMGSCVGVTGPAGGCVMSYGGLPAGFGEPGGPIGLLPGLTTSGTPPGYFLFLVVPLVAVVWGGVLAARRARAATGPQGAAAGALAGLVFGLLAVPASLLAQVMFRVDAGPTSDPVVTGTIAVGPFALAGALAALGWGVLGGASGGFIRARVGGTAPAEGAVELTPEGATPAPPPAS